MPSLLATCNAGTTLQNCHVFAEVPTIILPVEIDGDVPRGSGSACNPVPCNSMNVAGHDGRILRKVGFSDSSV